jgi:MerR family transcriptional regulator, light-induced transcriptional regulator
VPNFDRLRTEAVYNTRAVVQKTGVPADTFRAWERRYGLPTPCRTPGNQRLYSEQDIATIGWLRDQTMDGLTISQAVALFRSEASLEAAPESESSFLTMFRSVGMLASPASYRNLADGQEETDFVGADGEPQPIKRSLYELVADALMRFDDAAAEQVIEEAIAILPVDQICSQVFEPALAEVGSRWQRQEIGVGVEHFASAFVLRKIGTLFNLSQPHIGKGPVVAACVEGERHEIGLLLTALSLSKGGYRVIYLGPNLPIEDLCNAVTSLNPPVVLLSASTEETAQHLISSIQALRDRVIHNEGGTQRPLIAYGGGVFVKNPDLRSRIDANYLSCRACDANRAVDRLLANIGTDA